LTVEVAVLVTDFTVAVDVLATLVTVDCAAATGEVVVVVASSLGLVFGDAGVGTLADTLTDGVVTWIDGVVTVTEGVDTLTDGTLPSGAGVVVEVVALGVGRGT
jgi:hypothetical protein